MNRPLLRHYIYGYLEQLSSFFSLALVNILLPNMMGAEAFGQLNYAYAYPMLAAGVLGEGLALLLISEEGREPGGGIRGIFGPMVRRVIGLSMLVTLVALGMSSALAPSRILKAVSWRFLLSLALTNVLLPLYVAQCAWLTARLENRKVVLLGLANGLAYFGLPLVCQNMRLPFYLVPVGVYGLGVLFGQFALRQVGLTVPWKALWTRSKGRPKPWSKSLGLIAPAVYRNLLVWIPVLYLAGRRDYGGSATYKIAISILLGLATLVPFPRKTVLSLSQGEGRDTSGPLARAARLSLLVAAGGVVCVWLLHGPVVTTLYGPRFPMLSQSLRVMAPALFLVVGMDILSIALITKHAIDRLVIAYAVAILGGGVALLGVGASWIPAWGAAGYLAALLMWERSTLRTATSWARGGLLVLTAFFLPSIAFQGRTWGTPLAASLALVAFLACFKRALWNRRQFQSSERQP